MGKGKDKKNMEIQNGEHEKERNVKGKQTSNSKKEIVLKVYMHCEGCATKVSNCLKGFDGVEGVKADLENDKVLVMGEKADPTKVLERIKKKFSKNAELISPKQKPNEKKEAEKKKEEPKIKIIVLKMYMHCQGCADDIKRGLLRMEGIVSVETDMIKSIVTVRSVTDGPELVENIAKRLGKHAEIVKQTKQSEKSNNDNKLKEGKIIFQYPPQYSAQHIYPTCFSDENIFSCSIM